MTLNALPRNSGTRRCLDRSRDADLLSTPAQIKKSALTVVLFFTPKATQARRHGMSPSQCHFRRRDDPRRESAESAGGDPPLPFFSCLKFA